ncbi:high mobility group nucleosome-binding domain-containing protein 5-like [Forsythia ovata]|uniref:High mobility group nucleosome-binding domain-containing protein 5-like n=1 Tax=Forsythia ovata TaxID=205694 RepID=A0ABD1P5T1_9LAMI
MGCGESKHAVATENTITKSESKNSNSKKVAENFVEEKESLIKESGLDGNVKERESLEEVKVEEKGGGNNKVEDNGNGESGVDENVKEKENSEEGKENVKVEEEIKGGNAKETDNENGKSEVDEEGENKELKEVKYDEISVHQEVVVVDVQEPEAEKLKREKESIIPKENASEGKMDLNDHVEGKEINEEANKESKTEEAVIKVDEGKEVKEEVVPIVETKDSATKGE